MSLPNSPTRSSIVPDSPRPRMPSALGKQKSDNGTSRELQPSPQSRTPRHPDSQITVHQDIGRAESAAPIIKPYNFVNDFLVKNYDLIVPKSHNIADSDSNFENVEDSLNGFSESSKAVIKGLIAMVHLHPMIGIAVVAFASVITLDLNRRDTDRKVTAVKVQMKDMMAVFYKLRHVPSEIGLRSIKKRLEKLVKVIAKDIKECGSACDMYLNKSFLAKTVKSCVYENRLSDFAMLFVEHRKSLEFLAAHISLGVGSADEKQDDQNTELQDTEKKLDMIMLFRKLDTPREKDVLKFIEDHGGAEACITNDELLEELVTRSGESLSQFSGHESDRRSNYLPEIKKRLLREMEEDIEEAFSRNMVIFEGKLDILSKQLEDAIQEESDHLYTIPGAPGRITDPDLQKIWRDMQWGGRVKSRHFFLALQNYYSNRRSSGKTPTTPSISGLPSSQTTQRVNMMFSEKRLDDRWALAYIKDVHIRPILEAVDYDMTGFVSVKQVNTFVAERPESWSLPHWIAYWAIGWQSSISRYKDKIYKLIQTMFHTLGHVLPSNRRYTDEYLFHSSFWRIELLLRSTRSISSKIILDPNLSTMSESYERVEEERLVTNLQDIAYELDSPATVSLITGGRRIERYVFPLIYLLLQRHLKVMTLACKHVLNTEEFVTLNDSLVSILQAVDYRVQNLEAILKQNHLDVQVNLRNFAFGLFQLSYGNIRRIPLDNSFGSWSNPKGESGIIRKNQVSHDDLKSLAEKIPNDILKYDIHGYSVTDYNEFEPHRMLDSSSIEGTWTGHYRRRVGDELVSCVLRISIRDSSTPKQITGNGEDYAGVFEFSGEIIATQPSALQFALIFTYETEDTSRTFIGNLDFASVLVTAQWSTHIRDGSWDLGLAEKFFLRRTPPTLLRYRYTLSQFLEDPVRSRWSFACSAVLHEAQKKNWSHRFFEARFTERKRYLGLATRSLIVQMGLTPQNPLSLAEKRELGYLRQKLNPFEARIYQTLAEFEIRKLPWHPGSECDWCELKITKYRILCIHCMSEDLSDNINLCASCMDKAPIKRNFTHEVTHPVVKVEQTLHDYDLVRIIEAAGNSYDRMKAIFRAMESTHLRLDDKRNPSLQPEASRSDTSCACCGKDVLLPCWVCIECTQDIFVCAACDSKRISSRVEGHTFAHALVGIHDISIQGESASSDDRLVALEQHLLSTKFKVAEGFSSRKAEVEEHLGEIEAKINYVEGRSYAYPEVPEPLMMVQSISEATLSSFGIPPGLRLSERCITADLALDHMLQKEPDIRKALIDARFEGAYVIQAGFNEELMDLGRYDQEIHLFLDKTVPFELLTLTLGPIISPFFGTIHTPEASQPIPSTSLAGRPDSGLAYILRGHSTGSSQSAQTGQNPNSGGHSEHPATNKDVGENQNSGDRGEGGSNNPTGGGSGGKDEDTDKGDSEEPTINGPRIPVPNSDDGQKTIEIPFCSTLDIQAAEDCTSVRFVTDSCVTIKIEENRDSESLSTPPGSTWYGPWIGLDMTSLHISAEGTILDTSRFTMGLSQVLMTALSCPKISVLQYSPTSIDFEEDSVKTKSEKTILGGAWLTIGASSNLRVGGTNSRGSGNEKMERRWAIRTHRVNSGSGRSLDIKDGMLWKFPHNENENNFQPSSGRDLHGSEAPSVMFGLSNESALPSVEVEVVVHWALSKIAQSRRFSFFNRNTKNRLSGFTNLLHHVSVAVDLCKVSQTRSWAPGVKSYDEWTSREPTKFDPVKVSIETSPGLRTVDSKSQITLRRAICGRIEPLSTDERTGSRPLVMPASSLELPLSELPATGLLTPILTPAGTPSLLLAQEKSPA